MFSLDHESIEQLRVMYLSGTTPSVLLRWIGSQAEGGNLHPAEFAQVFRAVFCFEETQASPIFGWRPDGSGFLQDDQIDYLMTKRIEKTKHLWAASITPSLSATS